MDKYHKDSEGNILEDEYTPKYPGGYPAQVTFDMIPEAKDDGWVPLQVFVPVMEELGLADNNPGMGTQQVYLKLGLDSIRPGAPTPSGGGGGGSGDGGGTGGAEDPNKTIPKGEKIDISDPLAKFTDVNKHWARESIAYVVKKNLFKGTTETTFSPEASMTRGMVVTVLHRLAGTPSANPSGMTDVKSGAWYAAAVDWAASKNIVKGVGGGLFAPNDEITREAFVTMLYNYTKATNPELGSAGDITKYSDAASVSSWATDAMKWACGSGFNCHHRGHPHRLRPGRDPWLILTQ